jgi:hypothetical protein
MRIRKKKVTVPLHPKLQEALEAQRAAFTAKFGREPGPHDPIFFDPDADVPRPINAEWMGRRCPR